jgi:hypothetical protein
MVMLKHSTLFHVVGTILQDLEDLEGFLAQSRAAVEYEGHLQILRALQGVVKAQWRREELEEVEVPQ